MINRTLRIAIMDSGLKDCDVAQKIGMSPSRFSMFMNGRVETKRERKVKIAEILGTPLESIFPEVAKEMAGASHG